MEPLSGLAAAGHVTAAALRTALRDSTVVLLTGMFLAMVLVSAYLGWSATRTMEQIYAAALISLKANHQTIPPDPLSELSPLALLRNMSIYVALLGALAALIFGNLVIATDRKSGVVPLIVSRPISRASYALGKLGAIATAIVALTLFAAIVNAATLLVLPQLSMTAALWMSLAGFYGVSALYMMAFGFLGATCAAYYRSESLALLVPVTVWLALTFIVPQITANISPMAALNPLSATAALPTGTFFAVTGAVLGPLSLAEAYRSLSSVLLQLCPDNLPHKSFSGAMATMLIATIGLGLAGVFAIVRFDASRSDYRD